MNYQFPRCQVIPLPDHQVAFQIDGTERLRWHHSPSYPRPFFYPLVGPSGHSLTRMGHPGAPDHDHHRSIWFAHHKVLGIDFWGDRTPAHIRQKQWLCYEDSDTEARMAILLGWYDGHDPKELLEQTLIVGVRPGPVGETFVEVQTTFKPTAVSLEFGQTNFGFLAVRVAKHLSAHFGRGYLLNSAGAKGEKAIFGKPATWMLYAGPSPDPKIGHEGIAYYDHPSNSGQPTCWHVREDGWMGASVCMNAAHTTTRDQPLTLRYLLHARGTVDLKTEQVDKIGNEFAASPGYEVVKASVPHEQWRIQRAPGR